MLRGKTAPPSPAHNGQMQTQQNSNGGQFVGTVGSYAAFVSLFGELAGGYWIYAQIQEIKKNQTDTGELMAKQVVPAVNSHGQAMKDIGEFVKRSNERMLELENAIKRLKKDKKLLLDRFEKISSSKNQKSKNKKKERSNRSLSDSDSELSQEESDDSEESESEKESSSEERNKKDKKSRSKKDSKRSKQEKNSKKHKSKDKKPNKDKKGDLKKEHDDEFDD